MIDPTANTFPLTNDAYYSNLQEWFLDKGYSRISFTSPGGDSGVLFGVLFTKDAGTPPLYAITGDTLTYNSSTETVNIT